MSSIARLVAGAALVGSAVTPASAASGCSVTATGYPGTPGHCRYVADGPGRFEVRSLSGFRISVSSNDGVSWRTLVAQVAIPNQPHTGIVAAEGILQTKPGELVDVAIGVSWYDGPSGRLRYQDGTATAGS